MSSPASRSPNANQRYLKLAISLSGRRLAKITALFILLALAYLYADEVPAAYQMIDGYIEIVLVARFATAVVLSGLLFGAVRPVSVFLVSGFYSISGANAQPARVRQTNKILYRLLWLGVLFLTFAMFRQDYNKAVFPFYQYPWLSDLLPYTWAALGLINLTLLGLAVLRRKTVAP